MKAKPSITFEQRKYPSTTTDGWDLVFSVVRLINTVKYEIGESLTKEEVEDLVNSDKFTVTIIPRR